MGTRKRVVDFDGLQPWGRLRPPARMSIHRAERMQLLLVLMQTMRYQLQRHPVIIHVQRALFIVIYQGNSSPRMHRDAMYNGKGSVSGLPLDLETTYGK